MPVHDKPGKRDDTVWQAGDLAMVIARNDSRRGRILEVTSVRDYYGNTCIDLMGLSGSFYAKGFCKIEPLDDFAVGAYLMEMAKMADAAEARARRK